MRRFYLPLILLFLIVIEGVALDLLPSSIMMEHWMVIPHWVLVFLMMIAIIYDFENTYVSVLYAIFFGLLIDIVYTNVLGVYMFSYALVTYIIHGLNKLLHHNFITAILLTIAGIALADIGINIVYFFIGTSPMIWEEYAMNRLVPTIIANGLFFIVLYIIFKRKLVQWSYERFDS